MNIIRKIKKRFHILFFLTIPLFFLFERINYLEIEYSFHLILNTTFYAVTGCAILYFILRIKFEREKSLTIIAISILFYLFFNSILDQFKKIDFSGFLTKSYFSYPFIFLLYILIILFVFKLYKHNKEKVITYINSVFLILSLFEIIKYINADNFNKKYKIRTEELEFRPVYNSKRPNIYLFILDEYAGANSLKEYFHYDNTPFISALKKRNFFVAKQPNSNYNLTWASLPSMLEMSYFKNYNRKEFEKDNIYIKLSECVKDNNLFGFLKRYNYKIYNNSYFYINNTLHDKTLIRDIKKSLVLSKTFGSVIKKGPLNHIPNNDIQLFLGTSFSHTLTYNKKVIKNTLEIIQKKEKPIFVFSHFWMPHPPFLFTEEGSVKKISFAYKELRDQNKLTGYIDNLKYSNKLTIQFIDSILMRKENCVIIICSDHGYRWRQENYKIEYDFNNFFAIYNKDQNYKGFTDSTNNVNIFRIILNNHFQQQLPLLKNYKIDLREGHF